ncbi:MAG: hypothetical protein OXU73_02500 [Candidatus Campbellbacteria bacterium]|nr:hypothetical protein [Candidatus Campbellbacteria bacterium]
MGDFGSKVLPSHTEDKVVFSFRYFKANDKTNKKQLVINLKLIFKKLEEINGQTWKQWAAKDRAHGGITIDKGHMKSEIRNAIDSAEDRELGRPFHFRINQNFRVFGIQCEQFCMVTHIDPNHERQV